MRTPWHDHKPVGDDPMWLCGDRTLVPLSGITDDHLQSIERFLLGRGHADAPARQELMRNWYDVIRDEMARRNLPVLKQDHPVAVARQERKEHGPNSYYENDGPGDFGGVPLADNFWSSQQ